MLFLKNLDTRQCSGIHESLLIVPLLFMKQEVHSNWAGYSCNFCLGIRDGLLPENVDKICYPGNFFWMQIKDAIHQWWQGLDASGKEGECFVNKILIESYFWHWNTEWSRNLKACRLSVLKPKSDSAQKAQNYESSV